MDPSAPRPEGSSTRGYYFDDYQGGDTDSNAATGSSASVEETLSTNQSNMSGDVRIASSQVDPAWANWLGKSLPDQVTHAIMVDGPDDAARILAGWKRIISKPWWISKGWVVVCAGDRRDPGMTEMPANALVGLVSIEEWKYQQER